VKKLMLVLVVVAAACAAPGMTAAIALGQPIGPKPVPQPPAGKPAEAIYFGTGGPYIPQAEALATARLAAIGVPGRQEIRLLTYADVIAFTRSRNYLYDPGREIYFVVTSAAWQGRGGQTADFTCGSYITLIDAPTGQVFAVGCGGAESWPLRLPPQFGP